MQIMEAVARRFSKLPDFARTHVACVRACLLFPGDTPWSNMATRPIVFRRDSRSWCRTSPGKQRRKAGNPGRFAWTVYNVFRQAMEAGAGR